MARSPFEWIRRVGRIAGSSILAGVLYLVVIVSMRLTQAATNDPKAPTLSVVLTSLGNPALLDTHGPRMPVLLVAVDDESTDAAILEHSITPNMTGVQLKLLVLRRSGGASHANWWRGTNVTFVDVAADRSLESLGLGAMWNVWRFYDLEGVEFARGSARSGGVSGAIATVVHGNDSFDVAVGKFLEGAYAAGEFAAQTSALDRSDQRHWMLFVSRGGTNCPVASALARLEIGARRSKSTSFSIAVPGDWNPDEVQAFREAFEVDLPVSRVSEATTRTWRHLEQEYGLSTAGAFVAVFDRTGVRSSFVETAAAQAIGDLLR